LAGLNAIKTYDEKLSPRQGLSGTGRSRSLGNNVNSIIA